MARITPDDVVVTGDISYDDTYWDDIVGSLIGKRLASTAGKVDYDYNENSIVFQPGGSIATTNDRVAWNNQKPHKAKVASGFKLHVHWEQPDSTARELTVRYRVQENSELKTTTWTTVVVDITAAGVFTYTSGTLNQISALATIDLSGVSISSTIQFQMARTDSNTGNISATFVDSHYEIDSPGSREEFVK